MTSERDNTLTDNERERLEALKRIEQARRELAQAERELAGGDSVPLVA